MKRQQIAAEKKIWDLAFATPINFYGQVVDEKGTSIPEADVSLSFSNKLSGGGTNESMKTDSDGLFHTSGHGLGITVGISKQGYYQMKQSGGVFGYCQGSGQIDPHPDPANPAVFVLRKMGETVPLIHLEKYIRIKKDGTPIQVDLTTGKLAMTGQANIQVEAWTYDQGHQPNSHTPYDWRCRISVPGGGLVARKGEFDFEAPAGSYTPFEEINMPASAGNQWRSQVTRQYFLKLADGQFARVEFQMIAEGDHFFGIKSYLNPAPGDRNLEFDDKKQIPVKP
jgi:hypothetical protein